MKSFVRLSVCFAHQRTRSRPNCQGVWGEGWARGWWTTRRMELNHPLPSSPWAGDSWYLTCCTQYNRPNWISPFYWPRELIEIAAARADRRENERVCQKYFWHPQPPPHLMGENVTNLIPCRVFQRYRVKFDVFVNYYSPLLFIRRFLTHRLKLC